MKLQIFIGITLIIGALALVIYVGYWGHVKSYDRGQCYSACNYIIKHNDDEETFLDYNGVAIQYTVLPTKYDRTAVAIAAGYDKQFGTADDIEVSLIDHNNLA